MRIRPCTSAATADCAPVPAAAARPRPNKQPAEWQTRTFLVVAEEELLPYVATTAAASACSSSNE
jgi:hypothetical protein|tara:strand:+ start:417 stop:611 length:195 start_codon:yes stop_codon:yes gene_type:complete